MPELTYTCTYTRRPTSTFTCAVGGKIVRRGTGLATRGQRVHPYARGLAVHDKSRPTGPVSISHVWVGRDGALVESMPFDRRVAGLNPALAST